MKTILYLGNTYCSNIIELKSIIDSSPAQDSLLGKELLCALKDGTLCQWLNEGNEEEQSLINMLPPIQTGSSDSDLLKKLGECFNSNYKTQTFHISDFVILKEVNYSLGNRPSSPISIKGGNIVCPRDEIVKMSFNFNFVVDKTIGEKADFYLRIRRNQDIIENYESKEVNLRELSKTLEMDFFISYIRNKENQTSVVEIELVSQFMGQETVIWNSTLSANVIKVSNVSFKMVYVEGGTFNMGEGHYREEPIHKVTVDSFFIAETQVTQELWETIMKNNPSHFEGKQHPVERVSWDSCKIFIKKLNKETGLNFRLPTEAEWEYSAKGGNQSKGYPRYSGDHKIKTVAWYYANSNYSTHPVKKRNPNEIGLFDMCGNVWEWCEDDYSEYSNSHIINPIVNDGSITKVIRGGSYDEYADRCTHTIRNSRDGNISYDSTIGFRLALDA